ncbi:MAG: hypothetical protein LKG20_08980 [Tetrasphaera jenkinsii]|nr:hypothetical protein [Tetrasphaera jenkinsii]
MIRRPSPSWVFVVAWLVAFAALQWSVVRFRVAIVVALTTAALLLTMWVVRRTTVRLTPATVATLLAGSALINVVVPLWSYLPAATERTVTVGFAVAALAAATMLVRRRSALLAWGIAVVTYVAAGAVAIATDPRPRIDVWVTLQQAVEAMARGVNFYTVNWTGSPGVKDAFTYLPWSAVLLAPGKLLAGDVRWMLLVWVVVAALGLWLLGRCAHDLLGPRPRDGQAAWTAAAVTALLLLAPGTLTQIDQAWTEPLLFTGLVWWAVLMVRDRAWWSVLPLALACASKQHLAAVLLVLAFWRPFGWRRAVATGALTAVLIAPWALSAPADFVHDTITFLVTFHPIKFANTWYLLALNEFGVELPFWVTGVAVLVPLVTALVAVRRRTPPIGEVVRWAALVLFAANLVNKQAFYNQYWLVAALVALSLVLDAAGRPTDTVSPESSAASRQPGTQRQPGAHRAVSANPSHDGPLVARTSPAPHLPHSG